MGDDEFTQGRPHPMIDPSLRDARIRDEVADPTTAVVLFDVVLGYGSAADPTAGLLGVIGSARAAAKAAGRTVAFIGYVCGTDSDPQDRGQIVAGLNSAGVLVAASNAEAANWSAAIIAERQWSTVVKALFEQKLNVINVGLQGFRDEHPSRGRGGDPSELGAALPVPTPLWAGLWRV